MTEPETRIPEAELDALDATTPAGAPESDGPLTLRRHRRPDGRQLLIVTFDDGDDA